MNNNFLDIAVHTLRFLLRPRLFVVTVLFVAFAVSYVAQSGRRNVRTDVPTPPVQAPIFSAPEPQPARERAEPAMMNGAVPESLLQRPLKALDNSSFRLADFDNKVVVVNLWASWCGPCRSEVPEYEKVRKDYAGGKVEFIGLTAEDPRVASDNVKKFVRSFNFGFRIGWIDHETARTLSEGRNSVPQTLVILPGGRIVSHWTGYTRGHSGDRLREAIENALKH
jgi:thiol-disulfide isomerase/thioredoxin